MKVGRHQPGRNGAALLAALFAVLLQALVIQTHVDGLGGLGQVATARAAAGQTTAPDIFKVALPRAEATCPICQAASAAGRTLLANGAALPLPPHTAQATLAAQLISVAARASHAWRSRAPPLAL